MNKLAENVLVLTYWSMKDALIQTYTLPYVRMIRKNISTNGRIYLITFEQAQQTIHKKEKSELAQRLKDEGIRWINFKYQRFGLGAGFRFLWMIFRLWWLIGQENISTIHSWCTPAGGIGWILSKMTGKRLILDSYEPHAEPMVEAGQWDADSLAFRILFSFEKYQSRHAKHAIACVALMEQYAKKKFDASFDSFYVKPAGVDFDLFHPSKSKNPDLLAKYGLEDKVVYVYAGKFGGSYLEREIFELLKEAELYYQNRFAVVLLNNHSSEYIINLSTEVGLNPDSIVHTFVRHEVVPDYMGLGDVGLVPFVPVPSKRYGSPIKTAEYLAMGIPIIIPKGISDDSEFIRTNNLGYVLNELSPEEYRLSIKYADKLMNSEPYLSKRCVSSVKAYRNFDQAEIIYQKLYASD